MEESSKTKTIRIALVDDHILLRDALAAIVNTFDDCQITLLASNGKEFMEKIRADNLPHLVILDLNMPQIDGYDTAKWLRSNYPEIFVLILTMYDSEIALIQLLQTGVRGFLKKDIHPGELRYAIQSVMSTGYYYSHNTTGRLVNLFKNDGVKNSLLNTIILSQNELAFLKLASTDLTYKEIALKMKISPRTIDNYRDSLFIKLNARSRVGLAIYAIRSGIVPLAY
ncbi:MAG TPA: response regulator transcription factor [Puia sp.]|nr:response regulator transcription factor [Puia sp.]